MGSVVQIEIDASGIDWIRFVWNGIEWNVWRRREGRQTIES